MIKKIALIHLNTSASILKNKRQVHHNHIVAGTIEPPRTHIGVVVNKE